MQKTIFNDFSITGWMPPTGNQLAQNFNGTVMLLDYGAISNCSYERTVYEIVPAVAYYVANVIRIFNFDPHQIELIGHSIGAHLAGYIGAALNGSIKRITGNKKLDSVLANCLYVF